jgi:PEP-CTERM motif
MTKMKKSFAMSALALAATLVAASAHANLLTNGSFEDSDIADGSFVSNAATGWSGSYFLMDPNAAGGLPGNVPPWPQAFAGEQYADIGNVPGSGISQSFTVVSAGNYVVSWADHTALGFSQPAWNSLYDVVLTGPSNLGVGSNVNAVQGATPWGFHAAVVNLSAGVYTLAFKPLGSSTLDILIDGVGVTAVPEPGTWALMVAGIAVVGSVARRRIG